MYFLSFCFASLSALSAHFVIHLKRHVFNNVLPEKFLFSLQMDLKVSLLKTSGKASKESGSCALAWKIFILKSSFFYKIIYCRFMYLPIMFFELCEHLVELLIGHQRLGIQGLQPNLSWWAVVDGGHDQVRVVLLHLKSSVVKGELLKHAQGLVLPRIVRPVAHTGSCRWK